MAKTPAHLSLAAAVILYHPTDADLANISTYLDDVDRLFVVDNTEGENNESRLPVSDKIKYIWKNENLGVAAALNLAATLAKKEGYTWLLTNDQDTSFRAGVLPALKNHAATVDNSLIAIVAPWHKTKLKSRRPRKNPDYPHDVMTSGNLLNLAIWEKLGGFDEDLFIDGVDLEYCIRLKKFGYKIFRDNSLEIDHNLGDLFYGRVRQFVFLCTNHTPIRRYYMMRNAHYLLDRYRDFDLSYCIELCAAQKRNMIGVLLFEKNKFAKIKMYLRGYRDYKKGIKGKYHAN
ncbi:glycosyltransferase [Candidatus Saccharibacteria bacterium]|nr:glycosyltransferase [Candidatus Saccharibacteria bacterium]